jgi:hypothetical protein
MTNQSIPDMISRIATMILDIDDDDFDMIDFMTELRPLLAPAIHSDLCIAIELCPMHLCDYRICLDDETAECAHLHN